MPIKSYAAFAGEHEFINGDGRPVRVRVFYVDRALAKMVNVWRKRPHGHHDATACGWHWEPLKANADAGAPVDHTKSTIWAGPYTSSRAAYQNARDLLHAPA